MMKDDDERVIRYRVFLIFTWFCFSRAYGFPRGLRSVELWGAEPSFELGPTVKQADALLSKPGQTLVLTFCNRIRTKIISDPSMP
jgi:hypothetical protein